MISTPNARLTPLRDRRLAIVGIGIAALIASSFEAGVIVALIALIEGIAADSLPREIDVSTANLLLGERELVLIGALAIVGMMVTQLAIAVIRARSVMSWQLEAQTFATETFLSASWETQSTSGNAALQVLLSRAAASAASLQAMMNVVAAIGALVMFLTVAFVSSPVAAIALIVAGSALLVVLRPIRHKSRQANEVSVIEQGKLASDATELQSVAAEITLFDVGDQAKARLVERISVATQARQRAAILTSIGATLYRTIGLALVLAGAVIASSQAGVNTARIGVTGLLLLRSLSYGQSLQTAWQALLNNQPFVAKVSDSLEEYANSAQPERVHDADSVAPIQMKASSYAYPDAAPALEAIDLTIRPGEMVGVVGPSGAGKSTLVHLLAAMRASGSGTITFDGIDINQLGRASLARLVAVVPQHPRTISASVHDNIGFLRADVSREQVVTAATSAGLHAEIEQLPQGYDTLLGPNHHQLSGGQQQRLGIARALLSEPKCLILDEPTSSLDALSEALVQQALDELHGNAIVVIVAHRLATLQRCDRVIVLDQGRLVAQGTAAEVIESSDFFRQSTELQKLAVSGSPQAKTLPTMPDSEARRAR